jgi:hypothetical protein
MPRALFKKKAIFPANPIYFLLIDIYAVIPPEELCKLSVTSAIGIFWPFPILFQHQGNRGVQDPRPISVESGTRDWPSRVGLP